MTKIDGIMRERSERLKKNKKSSPEAIIGCARALLRIMLALARKKTKYQELDKAATRIM